MNTTIHHIKPFKNHTVYTFLTFSKIKCSYKSIKTKEKAYKQSKNVDLLKFSMKTAHTVELRALYLFQYKKDHMKAGIPIKNGLLIPEHEVTVTTSRAGGPGGQHVNKASTKVTLHWNPSKSSALTPEQKERVIANISNMLTTEGDLVIHNSSTRSQLQNKKLAFDELAKKIRKALHVPKRRMKTKISKGVKEKRLQEKKQRSEVKKLRSKKAVIQ